ncbi:MAG: aminopeptidase [Kiritimatiellae bacterium]|nr:aminopeptidase [Kiritimatiellia bacterium]
MTQEKYVAGYRAFLTQGKTERKAYEAAVRLLEKAGFKPLSGKKKLKAGDRVYRGYHGKTLFAAVIGKAPTAQGLRVVGGHTDAPRLDLKPNPLYTKGDVTFFDTHMYGGIKKVQWLVLPLALYGTVVKKDGTKVDIAVGDNPDDPVFLISDILPHFGKEQQEKPLKDAVAAEDLDVIAGLGDIEALLKEQYGVEKDDLLSAELEIVPAGAPRETGLDRALLAAYGHDDRVCAYAGLSALLETAAGKPPAKTCAVVLCDKEEIGSVGASGMDSTFFENTVAELIERETTCGARDIDVRRALEASQMLSADVCAASDPHFPNADSIGNAARLGHGPCAIKYTGAASKSGANDARAEFVAAMRRVLDDAGIPWQMGELGRAEKGGGGTIAKFMARFGMDVLDFGTPLLNMHAPWELAAKEDCYNTQRAYRAFFAASEAALRL